MNTKTASIGTFNQTDTSPSEKHPNIKLAVRVVMVLWLGLISVLGFQGVFGATPGSPPLPILFGVILPLAIFFAAYFGSAGFRSYVLSADLRLATAIQAWRVAGMEFLALYAHGILPGLFAFPAGFGDIAIGLTAPWILLKLLRDPGFATNRSYVVWNILGILDLVVAVSLGALNSGFIPGLIGKVTSAPMSQMPLVLIPAYLVPFFIMLHFTALTQARRPARSK